MSEPGRKKLKYQTDYTTVPIKLLKLKANKLKEIAKRRKLTPTQMLCEMIDTEIYVWESLNGSLKMKESSLEKTEQELLDEVFNQYQ